MKIDKVVIKSNPAFPDSAQCTVEMSDDHGICYAYTMTAPNSTPPRVLVDSCVKAILDRSIKIITDRYYERTNVL